MGKYRIWKSNRKVENRFYVGEPAPEGEGAEVEGTSPREALVAYLGGWGALDSCYSTENSPHHFQGLCFNAYYAIGSCDVAQEEYYVEAVYGEE